MACLFGEELGELPTITCFMQSACEEEELGYNLRDYFFRVVSRTLGVIRSPCLPVILAARIWNPEENA